MSVCCELPAWYFGRKKEKIGLVSLDFGVIFANQYIKTMITLVFYELIQWYFEIHSIFVVVGILVLGRVVWQPCSV